MGGKDKDAKGKPSIFDRLKKLMNATEPDESQIENGEVDISSGDGQPRPIMEEIFSDSNQKMKTTKTSPLGDADKKERQKPVHLRVVKLEDIKKKPRRKKQKAQRQRKRRQRLPKLHRSRRKARSQRKAPLLKTRRRRNLHQKSRKRRGRINHRRNKKKARRTSRYRIRGWNKTYPRKVKRSKNRKRLNRQPEKMQPGLKRHCRMKERPRNLKTLPPRR